MHTHTISLSLSLYLSLSLSQVRKIETIGDAYWCAAGLEAPADHMDAGLVECVLFVECVLLIECVLFMHLPADHMDAGLVECVLLIECVLFMHLSGVNLNLNQTKLG